MNESRLDGEDNYRNAPRLGRRISTFQTILIFGYNLKKIKDNSVTILIEWLNGFTRST